MHRIGTRIISARKSAARQAPIDRVQPGLNKCKLNPDAVGAHATEVLADTVHFALNRSEMKRFKALLAAPRVENAPLRRLLSAAAPWER
ncbi:DUF1778 domain-containing protein [Stenotrophomonas rhizophila]|uniref:type II toxin -antitoxin system TacA 1-like antitoxin n=1 Tax=Stenotrophomonas rhizophila TaxID=216778 RepID=UPI00112F1A36|nr:DUF1778 domain-containing protein [Stenotrophomonas rhizophila]